MKHQSVHNTIDQYLNVLTYALISICSILLKKKRHQIHTYGVKLPLYKTCIRISNLSYKHRQGQTFRDNMHRISYCYSNFKNCVQSMHEALDKINNHV